jgi:hypothetical protein
VWFTVNLFLSGDLNACGCDDVNYISRVHVDDVVQTLIASMNKPSSGLVMNIADDRPSTRYEVCAKLPIPHCRSLIVDPSLPPSMNKSHISIVIYCGYRLLERHTPSQMPYHQSFNLGAILRL